MTRLKSDLLTILLAACDGSLHHVDARWSEDVALTVVMAAQGYPGEPRKGTEIKGVAAATALPDVQIFQAGTMLDGNILRANGGRVLNVTAVAASVREAQRKAYGAVDVIDWPGGFCRHDIGWRAVTA